MSTNKKNFTLIGIILFLVSTAFFLVVEITTLYIIAYVFILVGILGLYFSGLDLLQNPNAYPWSVAFPQTVFKYLIIQILFSSIFVVLEQLGIFALGTNYFLFVHIIVLAYFLIRVVMIKAGRDEIEKIDKKVAESTSDWRKLVLDMEVLANKDSKLDSLLELVKYSDPVGNETLIEYDKKIKTDILKLEKIIEESDDVRLMELISSLEKQIKDRNLRIKQLK